MLRIQGATPRFLRTLVAAIAIGAPMSLTSVAGADHNSSYRCNDCDSIGTLRVHGRSFRISSYRNASSQIARAFCQMGYQAWEDYDSVVIRVRYGRRPSFSWTGCDYGLRQSWRGDCLILNLRRVERHTQRPYRSPSVCVTSTRRPSVLRYPGDQTGGVCRTSSRPGVIITRGGYRDDPDWGRRYSPYRGNDYDRGWNRTWNRSCDSGVSVRWNWKSRDW